MKKTLFALFTLLSLSATNAFAQRNDGTSMTPVTMKGEELISTLENQQEMEIVRIEYDIVTTSKETTRSLTDEWEYGVVAFGDYRVEDLDLEVYRQTSNNKWVLVTKDDDNSDVAVVSFRPEKPGTYKFVVKVFKYAQNYNAAHYGLILYHE